MYFSQHLAAAILAAVPSIAAHLAPAPWNNITAPSTTQTVTAYKTYIPTPTQFKKGNTTYTVTKKSWVTVTDCPDNCTISFAPGHQQNVAPVTSCTESEPEAAASTGSSGSPSSSGSTGSSNTGAGYSSGSSSSNSTGSGASGAGYSNGSSFSNSTGSGASGAGYSSGSSSSNSTASGATGSTNGNSNSSGFNGTGSTGTGSNGIGSNGIGSTGTGSNGTGSSGSGFNGSGSTGNQNNTPAQTTSSGARLSTRLSGLAIAAICFIAL